MRLLRNTIRRLIQEEACASLNDKIYRGIEYMYSQGMKLEYGLYAPDFVSVRLIQVTSMKDETVGFLEATKDVQTHGGECGGAYVVGMAKILQPIHKKAGLGALLYDVALELVGEDGLAADRNSVSHDAIRNWKYFKKSSDYEKKPLDDKKGTYTPDDKKDDCDAGSYFEHGGSLFANEDPVPREYFQKHPLNQVVIKKDKTKPTLRCIEANDLIGKKYT